MKLACESTVILVILSVSDAIRDLTSFSYPLQTAFPCSLSSMALFQKLMPKFGIGRLVFFFWGGRWGGGVAVWRRGGGCRWVGWPCVLCVVSDVLLCILTKYFFRICLLVCLSSILSAAVSSGEFFPLLCSLALLAGASFRSGLLCTAELRFSDRFFGPCSHVVGLCSCKARRFVEALRSSWIFILLFFCLLPLFLVWFAVHARTASVFKPQDVFKRFEGLCRSVIV